MNRRALLVAVSAFAFAAIAGTLYYRNLGDVPGGQVLGGPFVLTGTEGKPVSNEDFRGKWLLIYFGFTYCPEACPTALNTFSLLLERLGKKAASVQPIFISVDPERDTPASLKAYLASFDSRIVGLTGSPAEIAAIAKSYRVFYRKTGDGPDYLVDHSTAMIVMDPNLRFAGILSAEFSLDDMTSRLTEMMQSEN